MDVEVDQLHSRARTLADWFKDGWKRSYIEEAIKLDRKALARRPPGHTNRAASLTQLSIRLYDRYSRYGEMKDIEEAIVLDREALDLRLPGHPERSSSLTSLADRLCTRYNQHGEMHGLEEAIVLSREALHLRPPGHPDRSIPLNDLAAYLLTRYQQQGSIEDLEKAIVLGREAVLLRPPRHPDRQESLTNVAHSLFTRYKQHGTMDDLQEAIALGRETLHLRPPGHPHRSISLNNVALYLFTRHQQQGAIEELEEAITLAREALHLCPPSHPNRSSSLNTLALYLFTRYKQHGAIEDLGGATTLGREALHIRPPGHPHRPIALNNVAVYLFARYKQHGAIEDLEEVIALGREALHLLPPSHHDRSMPLNNITVHLFARYDQLGRKQDLDEVIIPSREALGLRPPGHPDRSSSLQSISVYLFTRYNQLRRTQDLEEAIILGGEALGLRRPGHPDRSASLNDISNRLFTQDKQHRANQDLEDAIVLGREALRLQPPGHPNRSKSLDSLAGYLSERFRQTKQVEDKEEVFSLYAQLADLSQFVFSADLSAAKSWITLAKHFQHSTLLLAYETSLRLLAQHLVTLPSLPQHFVIMKNHTSSLAVDAFSECLHHLSPAKAVELLEQGRGVFWSQLTRLRLPLDDVIASGPAAKTLADEFARLASLIRNTLNSTGANQHERVYLLNVEMQKVVTKIRELPGLSRFLLPSLFPDLQRAASEGPVIVVNASKHGCDALVVFSDRDPVHIPLLITQQGVRELSKELSTLTMRAKKADMSRDFALFLRKLWDEIVSPIVHFLQVTLSTQSRIWWCPTAEFSLLPLHAAAPYRKGRRSLADMYISSYTPTLTALIRARRPNRSNVPDEGKRFAAIGQAKAIGEGELPSVSAELDSIGRLVEGLATFTRIDGEESCIARVGEELGENEWIHLACHGLPDPKQPFESAFALRDGRFTIQRIIGCELKNPEFAYLSACHTTVGDKESPDEVIHLAAAMQFAGFRSVIGTMWAVDDGETNKITSTFYRHMIDESNCLKHTRAAYALNRTMRSVNVPLDQKVLYIHIGA